MKAREKAFEALCEIVLKGQYSNLYLRKELSDFNNADKALITSIVYGTMQHSMYLRYQWVHFVKDKISEDMALLMDMSIYQFLMMDKVPEYAIVNEAVEIAAKKHKGKYKKMINAMLRRFLREGKKEVIGTPEEVLSIETSHPLWIVQMWKSQYGWENTVKICQEDQKIAPQCARVNTMAASREEIIAQNPMFQKGKLSPDALIYQKGNIADSEEYQKGLLTIQDEASQCVAHLLAPKPNDRVLDACAAPGTKTTHMAQLMQDKGEIIALDLHEHRVELIRKGAERLKLSIIHPQCADAMHVSEMFESESFDKVLCDVPCSGYGVMKRKNDIKVHMKSTDMDGIIPLQKAILEECAKMVKKEGILVYSTCTLNKKENEKQIEAFLKNHHDFELIVQKTIFPFEAETDGFYMAKLKRK